MLKLPLLDDVIRSSPASQVFYSMLYFVDVLFWEPVVAYSFKVFLRSYTFEAHQ